MLKRFLKSVRTEWGKLSRNEKLLLLGVVVYVVLVGIYFRHPSAILKYGTLLLGLFFVASVPEVAAENSLRLKVWLILLLAVGAAAMEYQKDQDDERDRLELMGKLDSQKRAIEVLRLVKYHESEHRRVERSIDRSTVSPRDEAKSLVKSGPGFLTKAERLSLRASLLESRLLTNAPSLAPQVLAFPEDAAQRLSEYDALKPVPTFTNAEAMRQIGDVEKVLSEEATYRRLAEYFAREIAPRYQALNEQSDSLDVATASQRLGEIEELLVKQLTNFPLAGLYNHLGNLAMGQGAVNRALGYFYTGIAQDPEHLPLYDSLSYAEWTFDHAAWPAIGYARQGIELSDKLPRQIEAEFNEASANYAWLLKSSPDLKNVLTARQETLQSSFNTAHAAVTNYAGVLRDHFEQAFAYNSALELQNEDLARQYAKRLNDTYPTDADYQDTWGFVLMRFARDSGEMEKAGKLLRGAEGNGEEMTQKLVQLHLKELSELQQEEPAGETTQGKP